MQARVAGDMADHAGETMCVVIDASPALAAIIRAMQAVEAARSDVGTDLAVKKLPTRLENEFYSGNDYEIALKK